MEERRIIWFSFVVIQLHHAIKFEEYGKVNVAAEDARSAHVGIGRREITEEEK